MAITRWDPFRELMSLQNEMNRLFSRSYGSGDVLDVGSRTWAPPLDIHEREDAYVITAEVPGVEPGNIEVTLEDSVLTIRGERRFYDKVEEESFHRVERRFGQFVRQLTLPGQVDGDKIDASYRDGLLTLTVPKSEAAKPKRITVKASA